jgi:hypothetical protein
MTPLSNFSGKPLGRGNAFSGAPSSLPHATRQLHHAVQMVQAEAACAQWLGWCVTTGHPGDSAAAGLFLAVLSAYDNEFLGCRPGGSGVRRPFPEVAMKLAASAPSPLFVTVLATLGLALATNVPAAPRMPADASVGFLHHSTGGVIWGGGVPAWIDAYNTAHSTSYTITEIAYPDSPYPWENYPYDYWNIWVQHAGATPYQGQATLELLTPQYDVIVFKHCFPVSGIGPNIGNPDVTSPAKTIENYQAQYAALRTKLLAFPNQRFIVWTGAALRAQDTTPEQAARAQSFFAWVRDAWDQPNDNIYVWDFFTLETDGGMYLTPAHASGDSHPNGTFAAQVAPLFAQRVVDVIEGRGDSTSTAVLPPPGPGFSFALAGANPHVGPVGFQLVLPAQADVQLDVFDVSGRWVARAAGEPLGAGAHVLTWNPQEQAGGVYFARVRCAGHEAMRSVVLLR